ncbi:hypothetical protein RJ639_012469 [Escallonia herrerae]|uniref:Amino acid transporter transmembrane domain-containing protein n=1 Tax=Escallonia herrerae TaxID=1293975 RepID=A0AA88VPQ2_9ASTE|nr:hypothetical protein RJ639_012469 [Escallonia herrerae]
MEGRGMCVLGTDKSKLVLEEFKWLLRLNKYGQSLKHEDIAFDFPCSVILLEIQSFPTEKVTMKKASTMIICMTTTLFFYLCCGGFGYAAFGNSTPGNLLTEFYEPLPAH